jgi:flagellar FliL protein
MPTATATAPAEAPEVPAADRRKGGKRRRLLLVVPLLVFLAVAGLLAKSHLAGAATPGPDLTKVPGAVVPLQSMTLNLTDGHFLKVGLALQLSEAATPAGGSAEGAAAAPAVDGSKALDAAIAILGARSYAQLLAPGGRAAAQKSLTAEVSKRYDGGVLKVYFTEFVMQ